MPNSDEKDAELRSWHGFFGVDAPVSSRLAYGHTGWKDARVLRDCEGGSVRKQLGLLLCLVGATALLGTPLTAFSALNEYLPLELGFYWEYQLPSGTELRTVDRHIELDADLIFVIVTTGTTPNAGLEEYWNNGESTRHEDAVLYGYHHTVDDTGRLYDPKVRMARKDMKVGDDWHDDVDIYLQPGNVHIGRYRFDHVVEDTMTIVLPAGLFHTAAVATTITPDKGGEPRPCDPTGRGMAAGSRGGKTWWAVATGVVQQELDGGGTAQLLDYDVLNPVEPSTWGRIKAQYR